MRCIVDRFEGGLAVCEKEDGSHVNIQRSFLPDGTREGCVLICDDGIWTLDLQAEEERRKRLFAKQEGLFS